MFNQEGEKLDLDLWLKNPKARTNESKNQKREKPQKADQSSQCNSQGSRIKVVLKGKNK